VSGRDRLMPWSGTGYPGSLVTGYAGHGLTDRVTWVPLSALAVSRGLNPKPTHGLATRPTLNECGNSAKFRKTVAC